MVDCKVTGDVLTITVDISKAAVDSARPSSTGKTKLVASTHGAVAIAAPHGDGMKLSLNLTVK